MYNALKSKMLNRYYYKVDRTFRFEDLEFKPHHNGEGVMASFDLGYGVWISVIGGGVGLYGDGVETFEIAFIAEPYLKKILTEKRSHTFINNLLDIKYWGGSQVCGWQTKKQISSYMRIFQRYADKLLYGDTHNIIGMDY